MHDLQAYFCIKRQTNLAGVAANTFSVSSFTTTNYRLSCLKNMLSQQLLGQHFLVPTSQRARRDQKTMGKELDVGSRTAPWPYLIIAAIGMVKR